SSWASALALGTLLVSAAATPSYAALIDFEDLNDLDSVTTQYAGVTFSNAIALSAGISLNEVDFPPHSGSNVIVDAGAPMSLTFAGAVSAFNGYFTYAAPLTLTAYALDGTALGSTASASSTNVGTSPNELLSLSGLGSIYSILIAGDP